MTTAPSGKAQYHHGRLREELIERALLALRTAGVEELSLRQLARELGVSQAAPRRHFEDKAALLDELAIVGFGRLTESFASLPDTDDFRHGFSAIAKCYVQFAIENPALLTLMFRAKRGPVEVASAAQRSFLPAAALLLRAQERGEVIPGDTETITIAAFSAVQGVIGFTNAGFYTAATVGSALDSALHVVFDGLTPRP